MTQMKLLAIALMLQGQAAGLHTWGSETLLKHDAEPHDGHAVATHAEHRGDRGHRGHESRGHDSHGHGPAEHGHEEHGHGHGSAGHASHGASAEQGSEGEEAAAHSHSSSHSFYGPDDEEIYAPAVTGQPQTAREWLLQKQNAKLMQELARYRIAEIAWDEHGDGSTQHHVMDRSTAAVSVMLLGAIAFQMGLFYLVNWPDEDIQYYSYHVIGRSISIFISVLVFDAVHDIVEFHFNLHEAPSGVQTLGAAVQMLAWFLVMQVVTAQVSGAMPWCKETPKVEEAKPEEREEIAAVWARRKLGCACWAGLCTHITAFAAINTWSRIQQGAFFRTNFWSAILVVPIAFVAISLLYEGAEWVRWLIAMAGDGEISASEELWDEESEEAENDVMAMTLSFTTVQAFQFWFLGELPDEKGTLHALATDPRWGWDCLFLVVIALFCAFLTFFVYRWTAKLCATYRSSESTRARLALISINYLSMCFAWCLFYAIKAFVHFAFHRVQTEALTAKIALALVVSLLSFLIIFVLDAIADAQTEGSEEQRAFAKIILAKGLLIGFSWEGCFATAFHCISHGFGEWVKVGNFGLSIALCIVVIPAYRMYILPEMDARLDMTQSKHKSISDMPS